MLAMEESIKTDKLKNQFSLVLHATQTVSLIFDRLNIIWAPVIFGTALASMIKKKGLNAGNILLQQTTQMTAVPGLLVIAGFAQKLATMSCSVPRG